MVRNYPRAITRSYTMNKKVLVVDDDSNLVFMVKAMLEKNGYEVSKYKKGDTLSFWLWMFRKGNMRRFLLVALIIFVVSCNHPKNIPQQVQSSFAQTNDQSVHSIMRARDVGVPFDGVPGKFNAITDVSGVQVGYSTVISDQGARTGVTAILPRGKDSQFNQVFAGWFTQNGNGEMTGTNS